MPKDGSKILRQQIKAGEKDLARILKDAQREVESKINKAIKKKNFASAASVRSGLYRGITSEYIKLNRKFDVFVDQQSNRVAKEWVGHVADDLPKGAKLIPFGQFSQKYLNDIVERVNPSTIDDRVLLNSRFGSMAKSDTDAIRVIVSDTLRKGAASGMTTPEMAREMKSRISEFSPGLILRDKNGRKMKADSYFAMINRTISANVARETYTSMSAEAGYDLQQVEGGITSGSLEPGDPCSRWAGKILSMSGTTKGYPTYAEAVADGLFHPNCIHSLSVVTPTGLPEAEEQRKEETKEGAEARKEVNKERKEEGLKPAKFGTASVANKGVKVTGDKLPKAKKVTEAKTFVPAKLPTNKEQTPLALKLTEKHGRILDEKKDFSNALRDYIRSGSSEILAVARGSVAGDSVKGKVLTAQVVKKRKQQLSTIDAGLSKATLGEDVRVWRGVKNLPSDRSIADKMIGTVISSDAPISTSISPRVAKGFAGADGAILEFTVGKDQSAFYADSMWRSKKAYAHIKKGGLGEAEVLLPASSKIKILGARVEDIDGVSRLIYEATMTTGVKF